MAPDKAGSEEPTVGEVLDELAALRALDSRLRSSQPGSPEYQHAADEVDRKSQDLIDRLRKLEQHGRAEGTAETP